MALSNFRYIAFVLLLSGCKAKECILVSDPNFYFQNGQCNHQENLKPGTAKKLYKEKITGSLKDPLHIQVLFRGKNNNLICLVNCNSGFQDPKYLGFYDGQKLKIIKNSFDLDLLYREYLAFKKVNDPDDPGKIWEYMEKFATQELLNKYNKLSF